MGADLIADIHSILDDEKLAILHARFIALPPLEEAKISLLAELSQAKHSNATLAILKAKLDENQELLASAITGVTAARRRIDALQSVRQSLSIYDQSGKLAVVSNNYRDVEKKA